MRRGWRRKLETVTRMESTREVATESLNDLLRCCFLRHVFFINPKLSKTILVGNFYGRGVGVLVNTAGNYVFWKFSDFYRVVTHFDEIQRAMECGNTNVKFTLEDGKFIRVTRIFGKPYVKMCDGRRTVTLTEGDFSQLLGKLPRVNTCVTELFSREQFVNCFLDKILKSDDHDRDVEEGLPDHIVNRLLEEKTYFKSGIEWRPS